VGIQALEAHNTPWLRPKKAFSLGKSSNFPVGWGLPGGHGFKIGDAIVGGGGQGLLPDSVEIASIRREIGGLAILQMNHLTFPGTLKV